MAGSPDIQEFFRAMRDEDIAAVTRMLDGGASVDAACEESPRIPRTPLDVAIECKSAPIVRLLVSRGADLERKSSTGRTPLEAVIYYRRKMAEKFLRELGARERRS